MAGNETSPGPAGAETSPGPAGADVFRLDDLRLSDRIELSVSGDDIVIGNGATGQSKAFPKRSLKVLDQIMNWTSPQRLVREALDSEEPSKAVEDAVQTFHDLMELGVLTSRKAELTGDRLPSPGAGWAPALRFLLETRTTRDTVYVPPTEFNTALAEKALIVRQASAFLEYPDAPFRQLPAPVTEATAEMPSLPAAMLKRRTARRYAEKALTESQLSTLLYFGWGMVSSVPNPLGDVFVRKTSPSGGSLHPVEVYPIVLNVEGVEKGVYHYSVRRHGLEQISAEDPAGWIVPALGDQDWVTEAGVIFLSTAFLPRSAWKYGFSRVARAVMAEVGYTGQSALLTAAWLGLGAFTTAALRDEIFEETLGLNPLRQPTFLVTGVGVLEADVADASRPRKETAAPVEGS